MCSQTLMMWIKSKVRNDILFFQKAMKDKLQIFRNQLSLEPTYKKNYFWIFFKIGILLVLLGRILELFSSRNNTEFNILSTIGRIFLYRKWNNFSVKQHFEIATLTNYSKIDMPLFQSENTVQNFRNSVNITGCISEQ